MKIMVQQSERLYTPGPTPLPPAVYDAAALPIIYHRSVEFAEIFRDFSALLQKLFFTQMPVLTLASSGTGAAEAAVMNLCGEHKKGATIANGRFGERWGNLMQVYGMEVYTHTIEWGKAPDAEEIEVFLRNNPDLDMIWLVHCETSSGTLTDIQKLLPVIRQNSNALICIDGITAVGIHECRMDKWGIDVLITASQKGLMSPPGLAFIALSQKAWDTVEKNKPKGIYFDLCKAREAYIKGTTPWTPAVTLVRATYTALQMIEQEGLENVWKRHEYNAQRMRDFFQCNNWNIFSQDPCNALTALAVPQQAHIIANKLLEHNIRVARGQKHLENDIIRVAHMGWCHEQDIIAIEQAFLEAFSS